MEFPVLLDMPTNATARDELYCTGSTQFKGARGDAGGGGLALQTGRSLVRFPMASLE